MPREPPVISAALPASEIIDPPEVDSLQSDRAAGFSGALPPHASPAPARGTERPQADRPSSAPDAIERRRPNVYAAHAHRLDHSIGSNRRHSETAPKIADGLMM